MDLKSEVAISCLPHYNNTGMLDPHPDCLRILLASVDAVLQLLLLQDLDLLVALAEVGLQLVDPASEVPEFRHCIEITVA